jgi:hypothetical protein
MSWGCAELTALSSGSLSAAAAAARLIPYILCLAYRARARCAVPPNPKTPEVRSGGSTISAIMAPLLVPLWPRGLRAGVCRSRTY